MIERKIGDILAENAEALVNSVNCVGVMGRGIALQFKRAFPENFKAYAQACRQGEVRPGRMFVFETGHLGNPRYIINFPTKRHWRGNSRMEDIDAGLESLAHVIRQSDIKSIAVPPLGSGLGGLEWIRVRPRIEEALRGIPDVKVVLFEPGGKRLENRAIKPREVPTMTPGRAVLVGLMDQYLRGLMEPFVTLLEIHKLMYFMQESGERLRLRFRPGAYGPYAENLRHVLREIDGYFISGYGDGGDTPERRIDLVPGAVADARRFLADHPATQARFGKVVRLVEGFETPLGLELLATVHWLAAENPDENERAIVERTYAWNERKQQFSEHQIGLALGVLREQGWYSSGSRSD